MEALKNEFHTNLKNGGTFIAQQTTLQENEECDIEIIHPISKASICLAAQTVWISPKNEGAGVAIINFGPPIRSQILDFIESSFPSNTSTNAAGKTTEDSPPTSEIQTPVLPNENPNPSIHEKLRNLSVTDQYKIARSGNSHERTALERIYGKSVWEPLLQNQRLTIPEVARIAKMGSLPRPLIDIIVNNPSWASSPPVRRALLTNPRLGREQIPKILNFMPQTELRLVPKQMAYTSMVRETARRLLR